MSEPFLARPAIEYKDSFIAAVREFEAEGDTPPWNYDRLEENFDEFVEVRRQRETDPIPGYVAQTDYWLIVDGQYAGEVNIRHALTDGLLRFGGHIGYRIRPSMRRKGYGTLQCKLGIEKAREIGIQRILITCDDNNTGSYKIIEANGGVLWDKVNNGREFKTRRYWINPEMKRGG